MNKIMPTQKPRLSLTLASETISLLGGLAEQVQQSAAGLARDLILEGLEHREDVALTRLAELRCIEGRATVKHSDAWS